LVKHNNHSEDLCSNFEHLEDFMQQIDKSHKQCRLKISQRIRLYQ